MKWRVWFPNISPGQLEAGCVSSEDSSSVWASLQTSATPTSTAIWHLTCVTMPPMDITTTLRNVTITNCQSLHPCSRYDDFVFLTTTKVVLQGGSMPFVGDLCRKIGCKWSIFIGSAIYRYYFIIPASMYLTQHNVQLSQGYIFCWHPRAYFIVP